MNVLLGLAAGAAAMMLGLALVLIPIALAGPQILDVQVSRLKVEAATEGSAAAIPQVDIDRAISYIRNFAAS